MNPSGQGSDARQSTVGTPHDGSASVRVTGSHRSRGYGEGRAALLSAAVHVVANEGLRNLTYRSVAREAGVSHALVAHHFGDRDSLLTEALRFSLNNSVASISTKPGSGDLDALFDGLSGFIEEYPDDLAFQYELILESRRRTELRPYVEAIYEAYIGAIHIELERAGAQPDEALSRLVYAAADGLVFAQLAVGSGENTERSLQHLRSLLSASART
ncbi:AcrR family transcriptional regulator [Prauserella sediminis]|uniref:AcrR family transcriptional regulator n=1 Tax=Prauserella sediminis TaxID=577680 RepID=A0A839XVL4_9PSEU|nr:TetR family transcriptional regulator [Prauserella sediminis]MBB3664573.1 AcrR family transcriptional regulator [Prauserella sediminis]